MIVTPAVRAFVVAFIVVVLAVGLALFGGLTVITQARDQSRVNADLMKIVLSISGCTVHDTAEQCSQRQVERSKSEGQERVLDVECRIRRALAGQSSPPAGERCSL